MATATGGRSPGTATTVTSRCNPRFTDHASNSDRGGEAAGWECPFPPILVRATIPATSAAITTSPSRLLRRSSRLRRWRSRCAAHRALISGGGQSSRGGSSSWAAGAPVANSSCAVGPGVRVQRSARSGRGTGGGACKAAGDAWTPVLLDHPAVFFCPGGDSKPWYLDFDRRLIDRPRTARTSGCRSPRPPAPGTGWAGRPGPAS